MCALSRLAGCIVLTWGVVGATAGATVAGEPIERLILQLSPKPAPSGILFSYLRLTPDYAADRDARAVAVDIDEALLDGLRNPEIMARLSGIDAANVESVLRIGDPGDAVVLITGSDGFAEKAAAVLTARGFKAQPAGEVCAMTNEYDLDEAPPEVPSDDPFGRGGASWYCLDAANDIVIVAPRIAVMTEAKARRTANPDCGLCDGFQAMAAAARTARGGQGEIISAIGFSGLAHVVEPNLVGLFVDAVEKGGANAFDEVKSQAEADAKRPPVAISPHVLSLMTSSRGPDGETAQIALLYSDLTAAEAAAPIVAERLATFEAGTERRKPVARDLTFAEGAGGARVAVLTLRYAKGEVRAALEEVALWWQATVLRTFSVLDPTR